MKEVTTKKRIEINAAPEKAFAFIADPRNITLVFPELAQVSNFSTDPLEKGSTYNFKYLMGGSLLNGVATVEKMKEPSLIVISTKGLGASVWTHEFTPSGSGSTYQVTMEYSIPDGLISEAEQQEIIASNDKAIELMTQRLKERLEKE